MRDKIRTVQVDYMRKCLRFARGNEVCRAEMWRQMEVACSITRILENEALQRHGHLNRMDETRLRRRIFEWQWVERRRRGSPALTWQTYSRG